MDRVNPLSRLKAVGARAEPASEADVLAGLLQRAGRGDQAAFGELYDGVSALVYGIVLKVVRDPSQAEEIAQEVFVEIWRLAPRYDANRGSVKSWIATVAHRRAVDRVRAEQSHRDRNDVVGRQLERDHDSVSELVLDRLDRTRVLNALDILTQDQRAAVELAYFGGHTYREVAALLDTAEGTVKGRIRDGLIKLRDHLGVNQ
ncbi:MAG: ECF RNA polymerase sigma factor SigK [Acidimicrobiales bacterium]|nr:ECF RNA polymerase sigma factor SigK [Acidimicrobiales bacterium]